MRVLAVTTILFALLVLTLEAPAAGPTPRDLIAALQTDPRDETIRELRQANARLTRRVTHWRQGYHYRGRRIRVERGAFREAMYRHPVGAHPLEVAFLCIYSHEKGAAGWATNTGNGYHGGLQMDASFQRTYGADFMQMFGGGAERWPRSVQIAVALRAFRTRGFYPWPNTARMCGLIG